MVVMQQQAHLSSTHVYARLAAGSLALFVGLVIGLSGCSLIPAPGPTASVADPASIIDVNQTWTDSAVGRSITIQKIGPMIHPLPLYVPYQGAGGGVDDSAMLGFRVVRDDSHTMYEMQFEIWQNLFQLVAANKRTAPCFEMRNPASDEPADLTAYDEAHTNAILAAIGGDVAFGSESSPNEGWMVCYVTKDLQRSFNTPGAVLKYTRKSGLILGSKQTLPEFSFSVPLA